MILVPTIPSTGTHFMREHLLEFHCKRVSHLWPNCMDEWAELIAEGHPMLVPLRHPLEVARSWKRRAHLKRGLDVLELPSWWRRLSGQIDPARPYYLPLDVPGKREVELMRINVNLGLELRTDWPIVREPWNGDGWGSHYDDVQLTEEEHQVAVVDILEELDPFFSRWYDPLPA